ncbi:MAG: DUF1657 domain-containing protein [Dethiobacter sp.]|nr:DUF1657 domain-containing protein [Dethiobacter sp.]
MTVGSRLKQTLAGLKGAEGTLRLYAQQARHEKTRAVFKEAVATTGQVIEDLEKRLSILEFEEPQYKGY